MHTLLLLTSLLPRCFVGLQYDISHSPLTSFQQAETPLLLKTIDKKQNGSLYTIVAFNLKQVQSQQEEDQKTLTNLIRRLREHSNPYAFSDYEVLKRIAHSTHPEAVKFLIETLQNPKAPDIWRHFAFSYVAGTGGKAGAEAVRKARGRRQALKPWYEQIDLDHLPEPTDDLEFEKKVDTRQDAKGRTWVLFHSGVLGTYFDLFIVEKKAKSWGRPLFTGLWSKAEDTFRLPPPPKFKGISVEALLAGEWIKVLPDNPTLLLDSDGDGLTDIVEQRLGTDPYKADTDGDGLKDAVDPCPNAVPRPLNDREKVIAVSVEAFSFGFHWNYPETLEVEHAKPFELYGYPCTLIWKTKEKRAVNADRDVPSSAMRVYDITFGDDLQTAKASVVIANGSGEHFLLKKINGEWFVVDILQTWDY